MVVGLRVFEMVLILGEVVAVVLGLELLTAVGFFLELGDMVGFSVYEV